MHTSWSSWPLMFSITLTCYKENSLQPISNFLTYVHWYSMIPNAIQCMHACITASHLQQNRMNHPCDLSLMIIFIPVFFLFCFQLLTDHDAFGKEPGTFRIVRKDVEERCYLVEVKSSSQKLFCFTMFYLFNQVDQSKQILMKIKMKILCWIM